jgi:rod shape-determining protein MreC
MLRLLKNSTLRVFAGVLICLLLGGMLSFGLRGKSSPLNSLVGLVAAPVQRLSAEAAHRFKDYFAYFKSAAALRDALEAEKSAVALLQERVVSYDKAQQKLKLYEEFLELKTEKENYRFAEASVIGLSQTGRYDVLTLSKGSAAGIKVQDPVLLGKRLVGLVTKVELSTCTVKTILNPDVHVSAYETASREIGVCSTTDALSRANLVYLPNLPRDTVISQNSIVCTSGLGGIFPSDLILGTVTQVRDDAQNIAAEALIDPAVDFDALREVFVLIAR